MATDLGDLADQLDMELAHEVTYPSLIDLLRGAVRYVNTGAGSAFALSGTTLNRDASANEQTLLILYAIYIHLRSEAIRWSKLAIVHSNVAGRTKIDGVEFALSKRYNDISAQIAALLGVMGTTGVLGEVGDAIAAELGETLPYTWPYTGTMHPPAWPYPYYV